MPTPPGVNYSQRLIAVGLAALASVLLLKIASQSGFGGSFFYLFAAVPVSYVHMRFGLISATVSVLLTVTGMAWMYSGADPILEYVLLFGLPSLLLPFFLRKGWKWDRASVLTILVMVVLSGSVATVVVADQGISISVFVDRYVQSQMELVRNSFPAGSEFSAEQLRDLRQFIRELEQWLLQVYPAIIILGMAVFVLIQVWALSLLSGRHFSLPGDAYVDWKTPELLIWVLIGSGLLVITTDGLIKQFGLNLLLILLLAYFIQGLAIVTNLFERRRVPMFLRIPGYMMILFLNPLPIIVAGVGVFDLWIDFRKKTYKRE
jgi:uncharacterized protein YybS (DUF2232 family)